MKSFLQTLLFFLLVTQICFAQWYQQMSGTTRHLNGVSFYDLDNGIAVGDSGMILSTTDGGTTWTSLSSLTNANLNAVAYKSGNWVVVGSQGTIIRNGIIQTSGTMNQLLGVSFPDANYGMAVGDSGTILRTIDGGSTWAAQTSGTTAVLHSVSFTDSDIGTAVGYGFNGTFYEYTILRTINGGTTWYSQTTGGANWLLVGVSFTDSNTGNAVGNTLNGGAILRTTNGGTTWTEQSAGVFNYLNGVSFTDSNNGTVVGYHLNGEEIILRTTNGGTIWTTQLSLIIIGGLSSVYFADENNGTAVGYAGTILHTTNGGVTFFDEEQFNEIPTEFLLSNNYPNPFNPSTNIKYSVLQTSQVQIKVFDVLGSEIETLVNEEKPTGTYELTWNAANLPSGIYFYQLRAGDFIQTKKMILLK